MHQSWVPRSCAYVSVERRKEGRSPINILAQMLKALHPCGAKLSEVNVEVALNSQCLSAASTIWRLLVRHPLSLGTRWRNLCQGERLAAASLGRTGGGVPSLPPHAFSKRGQGQSNQAAVEHCQPNPRKALGSTVQPLLMGGSMFHIFCSIFFFLLLYDTF